jgi:hemerythrin superfamily protein
MKATDLLKKQHKIVGDLFEQIKKTKEAKKKKALFEELASSLAAHDTIEREIFYPAVEKNMGITDLLGEALVEHGVVEFSLYLADEALGKDDFDFKVKVLSEIVEHHVEEEEKEFFPKVDKALGAALLEELCVKMEARFEEAKAADFRGPLHENLRQVLKGVLEPSPTKGAKQHAAKKVLALKPAKAAKKSTKTARAA